LLGSSKLGRFEVQQRGYALEALNKSPKWTKRKIPPIQLMVWSAGQGSPGDDAFNFIGISKQQVAQMPTAARQAIARSVRSKILAYPHWREVLSALHLEPLTLPLPPSEAGSGSPEADWPGGGESIHHKRLKMYLASHHWKLGLKGDFQATVEVCLPSGDKIDLVLRNAEQTTCICVEVKSRISGDDDLIRGIFQCVKYQAVLAAQDRYELQRNQHYAKRTIRPILATERSLSVEFRTMCEFLNIQVVTVIVPDSYRVP
jgi:hypothetical protein